MVAGILNSVLHLNVSRAATDYLIKEMISKANEIK